MIRNFTLIVTACLGLVFSAFAQPANDICANAAPLTVNGAAVNGTNVATVTDTPNPSCGGTGIKDVWYSFVYTGGTVTITTTLGTLNDTRLAVYSSCGGTQLACNDDYGGGGLASQIVLNCLTLTNGQSYRIQAGGYNTLTGTFSINITGTNAGCTDIAATNYNSCATVNNGSCQYPAGAPSNDVCANAVILTVNAASLNTSNLLTVTNGPNPACGGTGIKDIWFAFVYGGGNVSISLAASTNTGTQLADPRLAVYASCGGTQLACDDDDGPGNFPVINFGCPAGSGGAAANEDDVLIQGQMYFVQAGGFNATAGIFSIRITSTSVQGCTNPNATNYAPCATIDNGSCVFPALSASFSNFPTGMNCNTLQFLDQSGGNVNGWQWSFTGGTPSTSILENPVVTYPAPGIYSVTLIISDPQNGNASVTQNAVVDAGSIMTVDITADNLPQQTTWKVFDVNDNLVAQGTTNDASFCIADNCHRFEIYDTGGNGICCANGNGAYQLFLDGIPVASGGTFGFLDFKEVNCPVGTSCNNPILAQLGVLEVPRPNTWYEFTPALNGQYRISTCDLAFCDTHIWIYDYCNMANFDDTEEATYTANDDFCGVQAEATPYLNSGVTYYVRVGDTGSACGLDAFEVLFEYMGPIAGCMDVLACNYSPLAELPGTCYYNDDPNCSDLGPDLYLDGGVLFSSLYATSMNNVSPSSCLIVEGCLQGSGNRQILRFTTRIDNIGNQDYFIGQPNASNPQFVYGECHNHYHYAGYAEYLLFNENGEPMPQIGFKNGFCVLDIGCTTGVAKFGCGNMGLTAGCYDVYGSGLECQWIDITDVPAGEYHLVVRTNWDQDPDAVGRYELRYDNNWAQVCISFGRDANNNIINFTKTNGAACPTFEDCIGQPFGSNQPDCVGNCPYITKKGDLDNDGVYTYDFAGSDVYEYMEAAIYGTVPVSPCTDLNNDGMISVLDGALLDACVHSQFGTPPAQITECGWDDPFLDNSQNVVLGVSSINTAQNYVDLYIVNPNGEVNGMQFEMAGLSIDHIESLVPFATWQVHLHEEEGGTAIVAAGHIDTDIPVNFAPFPFMRVYYTELTSNQVCVTNITEILNQSLHRVLFSIGDCQQAVSIIANFEASATQVCTGAQVSYSDLSSGGATNWVWSFPGASPASSSAQNPQVNYYTSGTYTVTLTAGNGITNDVEVKTNYITVNASVTQYMDADSDGFGNQFVTISNCIPQQGYVLVAGDCNDNNGSRYPGAPELCNGVDDDCDGSTDEGFDQDMDGFTTCQGDCDDNSGIRYPGAPELCNAIDDDCDGIVDEGFDQDGDGYTVCQGDCSDNINAVNPGATEICNGIDDDCDGQTDEGFDLDGDSYSTCEGDCNDNNGSVNPGATEICGNGIDDDCNGSAAGDNPVVNCPPNQTVSCELDPESFGTALLVGGCPGEVLVYSTDFDLNTCSPSVTRTWTLERNGSAVASCSQIVLQFDTTDPEVSYPSAGVTVVAGLGATEAAGFFTIDAVDLCNAVTTTTSHDSGDLFPLGSTLITFTATDACSNSTSGSFLMNVIATGLYYADADSDGFGDPLSSYQGSNPPQGYIPLAGDCDDDNGEVNPGADEICGNGIDDDCDGIVEGDAPVVVCTGAVQVLADCGADSESFGTAALVGACPGEAVSYASASETYNGVLGCGTLITRTWSLVREGATVASCSQLVYILDGGSPQFDACPGNSVVEAQPGAIGAVVNFVVNAEDDCDGLSVTGSIASGSTFPLGATNVVYTATDACQNVSTCSFTVTVVPMFIWYVDNDGDTFGNTSVSQISAAQPGGYVLQGGDCNDNNASIHPGAAEVCGNGTDDDCDGAVNEGCAGGPPPANDAYAAFVPITVQTFGSCTGVSGTVLDATPSSQATSAVVTGEDVWYRFTANSPGVRIVVTTTSFDAVIELQNAMGVVVDSEDAVNGLGTEMLNYFNPNAPLLQGAIYYVAVRNKNSAMGAGAFTICAQRMIASVCNMGPGPYTSGSNFKATFTGAWTYTFAFQSQSTNQVTTVSSTGGYTIVPLSSLVLGQLYNVSISCTYQVANGAGMMEPITISSPNACWLEMAAPPAAPSIFLRVADQCVTGPKLPNSIIGANSWTGGATHYEWRFRQVSPVLGSFGSPVASSPINRFLNITPLALATGATYDVQVRAMYTGGVVGNWGPTRCLQITGTSGMIAEQGEDNSVFRIASDDNNLSVFPNPADGETLTVSWTADIKGMANVVIADLSGREVYLSRFAADDRNRFEIRFEQRLAPGVYMVQFIRGDERISERLVVVP